MWKTSEPQSLEAYLVQIERELRALPSQARADEMREIEAHLCAMIEARGDVAGVLTQFGKPRKVGRELRKAWERKQPEAWWCALGAVMFAINFYFCFAYPFMLGFYNFHQAIPTAGTDNFASNAQLTIFLLMFVASYAIGLFSPKRSYLGVATLLLLMSFPNPINEAFTAPTWGLILFVNLIISAAFGSYFGSRHSRRLLSRIANTN